MHSNGALAHVRRPRSVVCWFVVIDRELALMYQLQNTILPDMDSMLTVLDLCSQIEWSVHIYVYY